MTNSKLQTTLHFVEQRPLFVRNRSSSWFRRLSFKLVEVIKLAQKMNLSTKNFKILKSKTNKKTDADIKDDEKKIKNS